MPATPEHVDALRRGPRSWNEWRAQNPSIIPNLIGLALALGERQMGPINGGPINLSACRLRHANLRFATLTGANLEAADLSNADLSDARLNGACLSGANLSEAMLERADFAEANLAGANLSGANLAAARNLTQAQIDGALGDLFAVLPPHIERPQTWTGTVSNVVAPPRAESGLQTSESVTRARTPGETFSWLVGGPRSSRLGSGADS